MLYDCSSDFVPLHKELMNIDIELQVLADALKMKVSNTLVNGYIYCFWIFRCPD